MPTITENTVGVQMHVRQTLIDATRPKTLELLKKGMNRNIKKKSETLSR